MTKQDTLRCQIGTITSDTPETDAVQRWFPMAANVGGHVVDADFARKLERERDEARRASARWKSGAKDWRRFCFDYAARLKRLKEASK